MSCTNTQNISIENLQASTIVSKKAQLAAVAKLSKWEISGKLSVISPQNRSSVFINWKQFNKRDGNRFVDNTEIKMTNLLGILLANLTYDSRVAVMQSDGKTYVDATPQGLIKQLTGWELPVARLRQWIKALPTNDDIVTFDKHNLVSSITPTCSGCQMWTLRYAKYKRVNGIWLPHSVKLNTLDNQTRITINISQWVPR